ncbi:indolethylamine N-methyltransferase-like [Mantella aurantiaca]
MAHPTHKLYHKHEIDLRELSETYFTGNEDKGIKHDILIFPMANFQYQFKKGRAMGKTLIDISIGSFTHHLFYPFKFFQEIFMVRASESSTMELSKWLNGGIGPYSWTSKLAAAAELEGDSENLQEEESHLKSSIRQIVKCDFDQEIISSPVDLPPADCIISSSILETVSKSEEEYMRNLEKITKMMKPGGQILIYSFLSATHFSLGKERFHVFTHGADFVKNALSKMGLVIDYCAVQRRSNDSKLTDYKAVMFTAAHKGE